MPVNDLNERKDISNGHAIAMPEIPPRRTRRIQNGGRVERRS